MSLYLDSHYYEDQALEMAYDRYVDDLYDKWCAVQEQEAERWFSEELPEYESYEPRD
jgi:hypothetical protein